MAYIAVKVHIYRGGAPGAPHARAAGPGGVARPWCGRVERTLAGMGRPRPLRQDDERKGHTSETFLLPALIRRTVARLAKRTR